MSAIELLNIEWASLVGRRPPNKRRKRIELVYLSLSHDVTHDAEASAVRVDKDRKNHLSSLSFAPTEFAD